MYAVSLRQTVRRGAFLIITTAGVRPFICSHDHLELLRGEKLLFPCIITDMKFKAAYKGFFPDI